MQTEKTSGFTASSHVYKDICYNTVEQKSSKYLKCSIKMATENMMHPCYGIIHSHRLLIATRKNGVDGPLVRGEVNSRIAASVVRFYKIKETL